MTRQRRWSPGKGFIRLQEYGSVAVWMKPLEDGALLAAYFPGWDAALRRHQEKWIIELPRGTDFHWEIFDKPWRIHWLLDDKIHEPGSTLYNVKILKYERCNPSHKQVRDSQVRRHWAGWHRGYKHMWTRRRVRPWEGLDFGTELRSNFPRKIEDALSPKPTQRREYQQYMDKLREQWEQEAFQQEWAELHDHQD